MLWGGGLIVKINDMECPGNVKKHASGHICVDSNKYFYLFY